MDDLQITGVPAGDGSAAEGLVPAASPSGDVTPADAGQTAVATADSDTDLSGIIDAIPVDDTDLATQASQPHYQALVQQRSQLRALSTAVRELEPLRGYSEFGALATVKPKIEMANLLYSPMVDASGQQMLDPTTLTPYVTTRPFVQYLDTNSPGMPEQLLADLLDFETDAGNGQRRKLSLQTLDYWDKRYPNWWKDRYGPQIAPITGAVTPDELASFPSEYHAGVQLMPYGLRNSLSAYDEPEKIRILEDYKAKADRTARDASDAIAAQQAEARDNANRQAYIATKQREYLATIRQERFSALSQSLARQVTFSDDAATNSIMHGALGALLANLTDPDVDFIGKEQVLKPLGLTLDQKYYAALNRYYTSAASKVAYEVAGDAVQASNAEAEAQAAADQLSARLAVIALAVAAKMGAKQAAAAATLATSLTGATTVRPMAGTSTAPQQTGSLPPNMRPGSPEALAEIARQTGFVT